MENDDTAKNRGEAPSGPPVAPKKQTRKERSKTSATRKNADDDKKKSYRRSWRSTSPIRKIEIIIGAIVAAGAIGYLGVTIWGTLQAKWISERHPADERAWLSATIKGVNLPSPEEVLLKGSAPMGYSYVTDNVGKTIAKNVRARSSYSFGTEPQFPTQSEDDSTASYQTIFPQHPIEAYATRHPIILHRGEDMQWIAGKVHLYVYIFIDYDTVFDPGVRHHTRVCAVWMTPPQQLFCHTGNEAD